MKVAMIVGDQREEHGDYLRPNPSFGPAPSALLEGMEQVSDLELHILSCVRHEVSSPEKIAENIFYHPVQVPRWGFLRTLYIPSVLKLRSRIRRLGVSIVHGQGTERYYGLAAALSGRHSVLTIHGNMRAVARALNARPLSFHWWAARLEALAVHRAGGVICLSRYAERQVEDLAHRVWLVPNAVPASYFAIKADPAPLPRILCAGLICSYKNQNALIRALDSLDAGLPFRLVFAGPCLDDEYGREFRALVASRPWCEYVGALHPEELRGELSRATALVHPSLEDNCPMAILEAMAGKLPVIASHAGGMPDLVEREVTGLLCDPAEMESFPAAITRLLRDLAWSRTMGANGRIRAERDFYPVSVAQQHLKIYREICATTSAP